jgi:hypothetical protein
LLTPGQLAFLRYVIVEKHNTGVEDFIERMKEYLSRLDKSDKFDNSDKFDKSLELCTSHVGDLVSRIEDIIRCTKEISEEYIIHLLMKEKNIVKSEFDQRLAEKKIGLVEASLQLLSNNDSHGDDHGGDHGIIIRNILLSIFSIQILQCVENIVQDIKHISFYVAKYLLHWLEIPIAKNHQEYVESSRNFYNSFFQEVHRLGKFDEKLLASFSNLRRPDNLGGGYLVYRPNYYLYQIFLLDPDSMMNRNGYIWKMFVLDKVILARDFIQTGLFRSPGKDGGEKDSERRILHTLVSLGGQEVVDLLKLSNAGGEGEEKEEKEKKEKFDEESFKDDLVYYHQLGQEILDLIFSSTNLPIDVCKLVATF